MTLPLPALLFNPLPTPCPITLRYSWHNRLRMLLPMPNRLAQMYPSALGIGLHLLKNGWICSVIIHLLSSPMALTVCAPIVSQLCSRRSQSRKALSSINHNPTQSTFYQQVYHINLPMSIQISLPHSSIPCNTL